MSDHGQTRFSYLPQMLTSGCINKALFADLAEYADFHLDRSRHLVEDLRTCVPVECPTVVHGFFQSAWDALDATGRLIGFVLSNRYPGTADGGPEVRGPDCTFYTVRRDFGEHPASRNHPLIALMWDQTRDNPRQEYVRLSLFHHVSRFVPIPVTHGSRLPATSSLPPHLENLLHWQREIPSKPVSQAANDIVIWLEGFIRSSQKHLRSEVERLSNEES
ncbi:MAG: hypothetical protein ACOCR1_05630 [Planctomycetota bacterium]